METIVWLGTFDGSNAMQWQEGFAVYMNPDKMKPVTACA
jgi:hypothetical protein